MLSEALSRIGQIEDDFRVFQKVVCKKADCRDLERLEQRPP